MLDKLRKRRITNFAPAKINLFLHITSKYDNGYHEMQSLVCFANIGDRVTITTTKASSPPSLNISGEFAYQLNTDKKSYNNNLVMRAANALSKISEKPLNFSIDLEKNIPVSSGIGGGSSDAAATLRILCNIWDIDPNSKKINILASKLGADIPVCIGNHPQMLEGFGEKISPAPKMPPVPVVLVNPLKPCATPEVFSQYKPDFKQNIPLPHQFKTIDNLVSFLTETKNDLYVPAISVLPEIQNIMNEIGSQKDCMFSQMSGSGATCFGLFETSDKAEKCAHEIQQSNPEWWVKSGLLNYQS